MSTDTKALKTARTEHDVLPLIRKRFSTRAFTGEPLRSEELLTLFEAASWAPSSMNEQPWRYRYALHGTEWFEKLWSCLNPANQPWAKDAGVLVVSSGMKLLARNGQPNHYWLHDVGLANAQLLLQAASMDLFGHVMAGFDHDKAPITLGIDTEREQVACFIALGRLATPDHLIEPFHTREITPRSRRPLEETVISL